MKPTLLSVALLCQLCMGCSTSPNHNDAGQGKDAKAKDARTDSTKDAGNKDARADSAKDASADATGPKAPRPNIVFIVADDMHAFMSGAMGNKTIQTPHIDKLAKEGAFFSRMYLAIGQCSGSRATLWTGKYPHASGVFHNNGKLPTNQPLLPKLLSNAGYRTMMIGKCHITGNKYYETTSGGLDDKGKPISSDATVASFGFQERFLFFPGRGLLDGKNADGSVQDYFNFDIEKNGVVKQIRSTPAKPQFVTDLLTEEALRLIDDAAAKKENFFLWIAYNVPHDPWYTRNRPPEFNAQYGGSLRYDENSIPKPTAQLADDLSTKPPEQRAARVHRNFACSKEGKSDAYYKEHRCWYRKIGNVYKAASRPSEAGSVDTAREVAYHMVDNMDRNIGRVLQKLDTLNLANDTVIVFMGDNGVFFGEHQMYRKGPTFYEEQNRTPFIVRYPRGEGQAKHFDTLVSSVDVMPTILDLARVTIPAEAQGHSLSPVMDGRKKSVRDAAIMMYASQSTHAWPMRGVVSNNFKWIHYLSTTISDANYSDLSFDGQSYELYDLKNDPQELNNLLARKNKENTLALALTGPYANEIIGLRHRLAEFQTQYADPKHHALIDFKISKGAAGTLQLSWTSEVRTSTEIRYRPASCLKCRFEKSDDFTMQKTHKAELKGLNSGTAYDIRAYSITATGNGGYAKSTLITP